MKLIPLYINISVFKWIQGQSKSMVLPPRVRISKKAKAIALAFLLSTRSGGTRRLKGGNLR